MVIRRSQRRLATHYARKVSSGERVTYVIAVYEYPGDSTIVHFASQHLIPAIKLGYGPMWNINSLRVSLEE